MKWIIPDCVLRFPPAPRSGDYPVIAKNMGKSYGDHVVFAHADFTIKRGEKVAFVGKNGEGKSTLVKCIMGEIPYDGELKIGHNVKNRILCPKPGSAS